MMDIPTNFASQTKPIGQKNIGKVAQEALSELAGKGYTVQLGITENLAEQLMRLAEQPSIREYCPNDSSKRFKDIKSTSQWLAKGRAVFLLESLTKPGTIAGYGWVGLEESNYVKDGLSTFALRIAEEAQGQGLAEPFAKVIVYGGHDVFGLSNIWLETWSSNGGAVHIYHKIGFVDEAEIRAGRPTANGQTVEDSRLYMSLPVGLLSES